MKVCPKCKVEKSLDEFYKSRSECKACRREYNTLWCEKNAKKMKARDALYYAKNAEKLKARGALYYAKNAEKLKARGALYYAKNAEKIAQCRRNRYKTDPIFRMKCIIRALVRLSLKNKGFSKKSKTFEIVGMTGQELHDHLLVGFFQVYNKFPNENDLLDIDHIVPLASVNTEEGVLKLNHYSNLRYLIRTDNMNKSTKLDWAGPKI